MNWVKQIPNLVTLMNLFLGCWAIVWIMQPGLSISSSIEGDTLVNLPESMVLGSFCIFGAAIVDFFDGFVARLLKADSALGKQLDSLADVVSFGVAPSLIIYQFLRLAFAGREDGLDIDIIWLFPAFLPALASAYRLGRFNITESASTGFSGVPAPAAGITIAAFPLIYWYASSMTWLVDLLMSEYFWYASILIVAYLQVSTLPMLSLKMKHLNLKTMLPWLILAFLALGTAFFFSWLSIPVAFLAYVIISLIFQTK
ncbi:MAG: CDP-alcohol phosphatidyltransferase family protein [Sediminibacterium sp.]|nr:CDP-alcohol phosphatidyltransferase family protein [Sediminibacterium sp.]